MSFFNFLVNQKKKEKTHGISNPQTAVNDFIHFSLDGVAHLTATIAPGPYTYLSLPGAIKTAMNIASGTTFTLLYDELLSN